MGVNVESGKTQERNAEKRRLTKGRKLGSESGKVAREEKRQKGDASKVKETIKEKVMRAGDQRGYMRVEKKKAGEEKV